MLVLGLGEIVHSLNISPVEWWWRRGLWQGGPKISFLIFLRHRIKSHKTDNGSLLLFGFFGFVGVLYYLIRLGLGPGWRTWPKLSREAFEKQEEERSKNPRRAKASRPAIFQLPRNCGSQSRQDFDLGETSSWTTARLSVHPTTHNMLAGFQIRIPKSETSIQSLSTRRSLPRTMQEKVWQLKTILEEWSLTGTGQFDPWWTFCQLSQVTSMRISLLLSTTCVKSQIWDLTNLARPDLLARNLIV